MYVYMLQGSRVQRRSHWLVQLNDIRAGRGMRARGGVCQGVCLQNTHRPAPPSCHVGEISASLPPPVIPSLLTTSCSFIAGIEIYRRCRRRKDGGKAFFLLLPCFLLEKYEDSNWEGQSKVSTPHFPSDSKAEPVNRGAATSRNDV